MLLLVLDAVLSLAMTMLALSGLFMSYSLLKVINLAHGEFIAIGGFGAAVGSAAGLGWIGSCLCGVGAATLAGLMTELLVVRWFYGRHPALSLLGTWALSLAIVQGLRLSSGAAGIAMTVPIIGSTPLPGGGDYPLYRIVVLMVCTLVLVSLALVLSSRWGLTVRAAMEAPSRAEAFGIATQRTFQIAFTTGAALAGLAGALVAPLVAVLPDMGAEYTTLGFLALLLASTDRLSASLVACTLLSLAQFILASVFDANSAAIMTNAAALGTLIFLSRLRPTRTSATQMVGWKD